jgi:putative transposase
MRLPASEKLEIIRIVEQSHLPARRTLEMLGIRPSTFYRWVDRFQVGGPEALADKPSKPDRVWNRIPDDVRERILAMALDVPDLGPRELATRFTDSEGYFVSESSVYRLLKAHDLITSPVGPPLGLMPPSQADRSRSSATGAGWLGQSVLSIKALLEARKR